MRKLQAILFMLAISTLLLVSCSAEETEIEDRRDQIIMAIHEFAGQGKVPNHEWMAGETSFEQVKQQLGEPDQLKETANGMFADYSEQGLSLGITANEEVYDIRSSDESLQEISKEKVEEVLGTADEVSDSDERSVLVYDLGEQYALRFVFGDSAALHYISVLDQENSEIQTALHQMTIDEKLGQLVLMGIEGPHLDQTAKALIQKQHIGSIILFKRNFSTVTQSLALINHLKKANEQAETPLLISVDEEGGRVTRLPDALVKTPSNRYIGSTADGKYAFEMGELLADKLLAFGINVDFAPVLDVDSNPDNPVIGDRSYGSDPNIVAEAGIRQAEGMKSRDVIPAVKHFPGHGDTSVDSHIDLPVIAHSKERLQKVELKPFKEAIENGTDVVMVGHLMVQAYDKNLPASMSKSIIQGLLRDELKYEGVVITDDLIMGAVQKNYPIGESAVKAIEAGGDILLVGHGYDPVKQVLAALRQAVASGELTEKRIDQSVERIISLKREYDLSDKQHEKVDIDELNRRTNELLEKMKNEH